MSMPKRPWDHGSRHVVSRGLYIMYGLVSAPRLQGPGTFPVRIQANSAERIGGGGGGGGRAYSSSGQPNKYW